MEFETFPATSDLWACLKMSNQ